MDSVKSNPNSNLTVCVCDREREIVDRQQNKETKEVLATRELSTKFNSSKHYQG
jgi:hypothetical protein